jgi:hypothetical protein
MHITTRKYEEVLKNLFLTVFFVIPLNLFSQSNANDTVIIAPKDSYIQLKDSVPYFSNDSVILIQTDSDPYIINENDQTRNFYDSLRVRASRNNFTRRLYDIVVVTPETSDYKEIEKGSDENYLTYSGMKIRQIEVQRLNVFGSDINNPTISSANRTANILNKTHLNTAERIIRKNLLFKTGDAISPLTLSDNERILRELPYIDDARIFVVPVSDDEADIVVVTKDVYSIGFNYDYQGLKKGKLDIFDKNITGLGHSIEFNIPFDFEISDHPGFGFNYSINNIKRSFIDFNSFYLNGLGIKSHGLSINRNLVASTTKYAGGISLSKIRTTENLDTMTVASSLGYTLQDYWVLRSFLLNSVSVQRIIFGARYYNNNIFDRPFIFEDSYHDFQKYKIFLGSIAYSRQQYYKTNLIYAYGRTEDLPFGALVRFTAGKELNEFKNRFYLGLDASTGRSIRRLGYFHAGMAVGGYLYENEPEQGIISANINYFSNLIATGKSKIRNFVNLNYVRGVDRFSDEYLNFENKNGFAGFKNDTIRGSQRFSVGIESALFCPSELLGFRFVVYTFADVGMLSGTSVFVSRNFNLTSLGLGLRIRNDNLLFKTIQIRFAYFPNLPEFSRINNIVFSGEQLLRHSNFVPGRPAVIQYR